MGNFKICNYILIVVFLIGLQPLLLFAQKKNPYVIKFGEISVADFSTVNQVIDSGAQAVILFDRGYSYFRGTSKGWFELIFERHQKIKILSGNGKNAGNFSILQYFNADGEEKISKLKGSTFHLENGKIIETKLNEKDIYKEKLARNISVTKFGMPNVKEGAIIEIHYTVQSDFLFNLRPWEFQGDYPVLESEYTTSIPNFFSYAVIKQGYLPIPERQVREFVNFYSIRSKNELNVTGSDDKFNIRTNETEIRWKMTNVPALKDEPFITTKENYKSKFRFQLSDTRFSDGEPVNVMSTWPMVAEKLLADESFGLCFSQNNNWLNDDIKRLTTGQPTNMDKAKALYSYMRDKFSITRNNGIYVSNQPRTIWKEMKGSVVDANIMLTLLLQSIGLEADPVILSTRENGRTTENYPVIDQYNYVVCRAVIDGKEYFLDASNPLLGFGYLPLECFNGHAQLIKKEPRSVFFNADKLKEYKETQINFVKGNTTLWEGEIRSKFGYYESMAIRKKIKENGKDEIGREITRALPPETELKMVTTDNDSVLDAHMGLSYKVVPNYTKEEQIIYFNPFSGEQIKENPFMAAERKYPLEMPYMTKQSIVSKIQVPDGYTVDELPKMFNLKLDNSQGIFEYKIQFTEGVIKISSILEINRTNFSPAQYVKLRDFFSVVINKQNQQIVFKKKS